MNKKPCIAIIDENLMIQKFLSHYMSELFQVVCLQKENLINHLQHNLSTLDAILIDINSAENQVEYIIKSFGIQSKKTIIVLSGQQSNEEKINCLRWGADDYIAKPFIPEELLLKLYNRIQKSIV
jgi:DNA-binding response OmpR family regulator